MNSLNEKLLWYLGAAIAGGVMGYLVGDYIAYKFCDVEKGEESIPYNDEWIAVVQQQPTTSSIEKMDPRKDRINYANPQDKADLEELVGNYVSRDVFGPKIINEDQWLKSERVYDKVELRYYEEDDTVSNEDDEVVPSLQDLIGEPYSNAIPFGELSDDGDIVRIRVPSDKKDYEIVRIHGSYSSLILGMPVKQKSPKPKTPRKTTRRKEKGVEDDEVEE